MIAGDLNIPEATKMRILLDIVQHDSSMLLYYWYPHKEYRYQELYELHKEIHQLCEIIRKDYNLSPYVYKSPIG